MDESGHDLILRYHPAICLEVLMKTTKSLSQYDRPPVRDLNPGPPEDVAGVFNHSTTRSSVFIG
jgi:hypothetical protein